jgi:hypothetical protein
VTTHAISDAAKTRSRTLSLIPLACLLISQLMAKVLVTGGAGFIGSSIVEEPLKRGETIRVNDNFSTGRHEKRVTPLKGSESKTTGPLAELI